MASENESPIFSAIRAERTELLALLFRTDPAVGMQVRYLLPTILMLFAAPGIAAQGDAATLRDVMRSIATARSQPLLQSKLPNSSLELRPSCVALKWFKPTLWRRLMRTAQLRLSSCTMKRVG